MISFDTNVLVRLLVGDDPRQTTQALSLLDEADAAGEPCHLTDVVLCETVWVLDSAYNATKADLIAALGALFDDSRYHFDDSAVLRAAFNAFERGKADFSDYLIGARARKAGARTTYTFDRTLRGHEDFTVLA